MKRPGNYYIIFLYCICLFAFGAAGAQQLEVSLNRNQILIGEQIHYGLKVKLPPGSRAFFQLPGTAEHFDILEKKDVKAVKGENALEQVIVFTSFDSGRWFFPAIPVLIVSGNSRQTIYSDSIPIQVGYSPDDGTGRLRDIKGIRDVAKPDYFWYYLLLALAILFLLIFLAVRYFSRRKKMPKAVAGQSAYDEAISALIELEMSGLKNEDEVKQYYTRLAFIFKRYLGRKTARDFLGKTTGDILIDLQQLAPDHVHGLAFLLRLSDAVKFARFNPGGSENRLAIQKMRDHVTGIDHKL